MEGGVQGWSLALEAWVDCQPSGYVLEACRLVELLPTVSDRLTEQCRGGAAASRAAELFQRPQPDEPSVFESLLRPQQGKVHYLCFWSAFSKAAQVAGAEPCEGLAAEIETLRDCVLRRLEEEAKPGLPTWVLVEEVMRAAHMSMQPLFWKSAASSLAGQMQQEQIGIDELTSILLSWLHDSQLWGRSSAPSSSSSASPPLVGRRESSSSSSSSSCRSLWLRPWSAPREQHGMPVLLHIYDVSQEESIQRINQILAHRRAPIKFGGVFHAGVEVNGLEWSFGFSDRETRPGISCVEPKQHPAHHYRQTVALRRTLVDPESIADIIGALIEEYPGDDYNLLRRNCCHFADDFCRRLGVGGIPGWVHRLARLGAGVETMLNARRSISAALRGDDRFADC